MHCYLKENLALSGFPENLRDVLSSTELKWLAGEQAFEIGSELWQSQKVEFSSANASWFKAIVTDIDSFIVEVIFLSNADLQFSCTCPSGQMELFCVHCVAASLAWLSDKFDANELWSDAMSVLHEIDEVEDMVRRLKSCLNQLDREELIDLVLEWAREDPERAHALMNSQKMAPLLSWNS